MAKKFNFKRILELPQYDEAYKSESDRGKVILGAARLDDLLRMLISRAIVDGKDMEADNIFDGNNAILQSFGAKITIAYRFGLISDPEFNNLKVIKDIRNLFAHNLHDISFDEEDVAKKCKKFCFPEDLSLEDNAPNLRIFQSALYQLDFELQKRIESTTRIKSVLELIWTVSEDGSATIEDLD